MPGGHGRAGVPLWCALVALAACTVEVEDGGVVSLGEGTPDDTSAIPKLNKALTARETRAKRVRVATEARSVRIRAYDKTGSAANSITAPAPRDPWGKKSVKWEDAIDNAADAGVQLSKAAQAAVNNVAATKQVKSLPAAPQEAAKPIVPVVVNVMAAADQNNEEASQDAVSRGGARR